MRFSALHHTIRRLFLLTATFGLGLAVAADAAQAADSNGSLTLLPARFTLTGPKAAQRVLVEVREGEKFVADKTTQAVFTSSNPRVATVGKDGTVRPVGDGVATITAALTGTAGRKATAEVRVERARLPFVWSFRSHVLPVLTKAGCNGGACHGALAGKGGLKLTLRGFDPQADHNVLTRQAQGRRVVPGDPAHSLLLLKPTMQIGHAGGERIKKGSADYAVVGEWIQAGAPRPRPMDPTISQLEVYPSVTTLKAGDNQQIVVRAHYSDGHAEDVTRWVKFGTSDSQVATVDDSGAVKVMGSGEAAITIWFSSKVTFARIVSPFPAATENIEPRGTRSTRRETGDQNSSLSSVPSVSSVVIDTPINRKLAALNLPASPACTDGEFIRRAFLDAAGVLPTPKEVEAFLADTKPDKRVRLTDALLARSEFTDYWTYKWSDLFLVSSRKLNGTALTSFYNWIRDSVQQNKPWDRFAREIITATGSNLDNGAANYYLLHKDPIDLTETTTQAFLGMSVQCARCHNHPLEKWTQNDYYQMANTLSRVRLKNGDRAGEVLALATTDGNISHPRLGMPLPPRPLEGQEISLDDPRDRRELLADWLIAPDNPYFAKAVINRVWHSLMGRGLVEAEDDLRLTNPPSNQELFDALAADFVKNGFDVKRLIRSILLSDAYQRSAQPVGINAKDDRYYSHYLVRRLPAEVLLDSYSQVTGVPTEFAGSPRGTRALQLRDTQVASYFLTAFGRPERAQTCSCERQQGPSVAQALHLANGDTINQKLRAAGGLIDRLLRTEANDEEVLNDLYLTALARYPSESERAKLLSVLAENPTDPLASFAEQRAVRRPVLEDLFWAVLTDREFLFNH